MLRKTIFVFGGIILLTSCSQVVPENNGSGATSTEKGSGTVIVIGENQIHSSKEVCGEKTCAFQEYLEQLEKDGKFNLENTQYFQDRFALLVTRFPAKDELVKSPDFQIFVNDFYTEYFPCDWKVEVCTKKSKYNYDEQNFIWYIFMPQMVASEFQNKRGGGDSDTESIIQAIRRKYFATFDEKEAMEHVWKDKLMDKVKKIDLSKIDKKKLQEDNTYFEETILKPKTGLYDQIFDGVINPIPWEEQGQRLQSRNAVVELFFSKIKELGITQEFFFKSIGTSEQIFKRLDDKLESMNKIYGLRNKMPYDRYLRHDEIANYIFTNLPELNSKGDFNKDVLEVRHYTLLQFAFPDEDLYMMPDRAAKSNSLNNFMGENLVKYSKYMNEAKY